MATIKIEIWYTDDLTSPPEEVLYVGSIQEMMDCLAEGTDVIVEYDIYKHGQEDNEGMLDCRRIVITTGEWPDEECGP